MRSPSVRSLGFAIFAFLFPIPSALAAACHQPCGSPVSGDLVAPHISDALYILRTAVGVLTTCYPCECDTTGGGNGVTAADALVDLRRSVGLNQTLSCPVCGAVVGKPAYERGRAALERKDLPRADAEFTCALQAGPGASLRSAANLFGGLTEVLHFVADNPETQDLFLQFGGTGSLDFYHFTAAVPAPSLPYAANIRAVVLQGLDVVLKQALARLAIAKGDTLFSTTVTSAMLPAALNRGLASYDMDATDAAVFSSAFHLIRFVTHFTVGMYDDSTMDDMNDDWTQLCNSGFLSSRPQFFTVVDTKSKATARTELSAGLSDLALALTLVDAETDPQANDLLVRSDLPSSSYLRNENTVAAALASSMGVSTPLDTCAGSSLSLRLGQLLDSPLDRNDLPSFFFTPFGVCAANKTSFPDLTFHQIFNRAVSIDELAGMSRDGYPLCKVP